MSIEEANGALLTVNGLDVSYGVVPALRDVSLIVRQGEIVSLIGANGAGKTTLLRSLSGLEPALAGTIHFQNENITKLAAHERVSRGLAQAPEGRRIFTRMTVRENLLVGAYTSRNKAEIAADTAKVFDRFPRLYERREQRAGTLSGGEQQMLAIGRALMSRPKILLLDEPSMGLAPILVQAVFTLIREIHATGTTVLLVEQNAAAALAVSDRAYVLELGVITREGTGKELAGDQRLRDAYLGSA